MALKWNQVYIRNNQDREVHGTPARDFVQSSKPDLIRQGPFRDAVVLQAKGKAVTENEVVKEMLRAAFPDRVRFTGDAVSSGAALPARKGKENVVVAPLPDKKKAQFIGFNVKPTIGQADLINAGDLTSASTKTGEYRGPRSAAAKANDLGNRCKIMTAAVATAAKSGQIDQADTVLKVFMAPEFYFRGYDGGYPIEKISTIMDEMRKETAKDAYKDWVFVFGTAIGYLKHENSGGNTKYALKLTKVSPYGSGSILHVTHLEAHPDPLKGRDKASVCERIQQGTDPLFRWKASQASKGAESTVVMAQCANKERDEFLLLVEDGSAFQPGTVELVEPMSIEVFNVALVQKGGPEPADQPAGLRDAIVYKEFVSPIDYIGPQYGEHAKFHDPTGANRIIKIAHKVARVLPTEGSIDVLSAKINRAGTTETYKDILDQDQSYRISEVSKTGLGGGSVFTIDGVTFGVEVCLDHAKAKLIGFYTSGQALPGEPYPQLQLIPSWGMSITPECIACPTDGLIFNVDGNRCDSVARVNDRKYSCVGHPWVAETVSKPCPHNHYFCTGDPHDEIRAAGPGACPKCGDAMTTQYGCDAGWYDHPVEYGVASGACPVCGLAMAEHFYCPAPATTHPATYSPVAGTCACGLDFVSFGWCSGGVLSHPLASSSTPAACPHCAGPLKQLHYCDCAVPKGGLLALALGSFDCPACTNPARPYYWCQGKARHNCVLSLKSGACGSCGRPFKQYYPLLTVDLGTGIPIVDGPTDVPLPADLEWPRYFEGPGKVVVFEAKDIPPTEFVP
ncbi:MAG TPA: hypothetical protein VG734_03070 [Lacunisphaera sp.]|nr:hypothetical protein [Lacunisphaera sp.]